MICGQNYAPVISLHCETERQILISDVNGHFTILCTFLFTVAFIFFNISSAVRIPDFLQWLAKQTYAPGMTHA